MKSSALSGTRTTTCGRDAACVSVVFAQDVRLQFVTLEGQKSSCGRLQMCHIRF